MRKKVFYALPFGPNMSSILVFGQLGKPPIAYKYNNAGKSSLLSHLKYGAKRVRPNMGGEDPIKNGIRSAEKQQL